MNYIEDFKGYLTVQKAVSSNTLESYMRDINHYFEFLDKKQVKDAVKTELQTLEEYVELLGAEGLSQSTITRNVASIRCLYQYFIFAGLSTGNLARSIKLKKAVKKFPQIMTGTEIDLFLSQPDINTVKGCRDKAMLELLYATGIRVSELIDLDVNDINLQTGMIHCRCEKSDRVIPIYKKALSSVSQYLSRVRNAISTDESGQALFINLNGKRLTRQGFWKIVKQYTEQANISKDITPHTLRHSFALHLLENGAQLKDIQEMLGHADISSTQVYAKLMQNKFKDVYTKCHPRAKMV